MLKTAASGLGHGFQHLPRDPYIGGTLGDFLPALLYMKIIIIMKDTV